MEIPEFMNAARMHERGKPDVLRYELTLTPEPAENEVLIRVHAATVNHTDIFHRSGRFFIQKDLPHILGMDVAGEIVALGKGVKKWKLGERVVATFEALGRERNGAYAEYTTLPIDELHRIPDSLDYISAASIGLAFTTAWIALINNAKLRKREKVIINAASSGVGTAALQIVRWKEGQVIAISALDKAQRLRELGANMVFDRQSADLVALVMTATGDDGASLVMDLVGKDTLQQSIQMLDYNGRIISVGTLSGDEATINVMDLIMRNASIIGSFGFLKEGDFDQILSLFADGTFQPVIDVVMPMSKVADAHRRIEAKEAFGKIILVPDRLYNKD